MPSKEVLIRFLQTKLLNAFVVFPMKVTCTVHLIHLHFIISIIQSYYKRNRHFQHYVVRPVLTPCDVFLWGYIKDRVFVPPLPVSLNELKQRITTAVASVDEDMLRSVRTELDYRIDICRVTKGSHIEHL